MRIKYILLGLLIGAAFNNNFGYCEFSPKIQNLNNNNLNDFIDHKAKIIENEQKENLEKYPWTNDTKFKNSPNLIYKIILKSKIEGKDYIPTNTNLAVDGSQENFVLAEKIILKMEDNNVSSKKAIDEISKETKNKDRLSDVTLFLKASNVDEVIKNLDQDSLKKEFEKFSNLNSKNENSDSEKKINSDKGEDKKKIDEKKFEKKEINSKSYDETDKPELDIKTIDYRKPINMMNLSVKYDIPEMDAIAKNRALYGIWSTCENYKSGYYKNLNGDVFALPKTERAKNPWEILGISPDKENPNALWKSLESKLSSIAPKYKTEIIDSTETYQDLILKYSSTGENVVAVNFSNNDIAGFGAMSGIVSKWNVLFHICSGLYDSVLMNIPNSVPGKVMTYTSPLHSPESTLYSKNVSLIKVWNQGKFCALQKPTTLNVIHSSLKDVNLNNPNFEKILTQKIMMQIVVAILNENDVLITDQSLFGNQKSEIIKKIYLNILEKPIIKGKIKTIIFSGKMQKQ